MKDFAQLMEDVRTDQALAEALAPILEEYLCARALSAPRSAQRI